LGLSFASCVNVPWSAVFVSWCVKQAGATPTEFSFSAAHSEFVHAAIRNAGTGTGVFRALPVNVRGPTIGDIIQVNRNGQTFDYAFAETHAQYASHSAIVVEVGSDSAGRYAVAVGG